MPAISAQNTLRSLAGGLSSFRNRRVRLTHTGKAALAAAFVTFSAAVVSGNNLLYLLLATIAAAFLLSLAAGALNLRGISAELLPPDQVFRGAGFSLVVLLRSLGGPPKFGLRLASSGQRVLLERLDPGAEAALELRYDLPHRGLNRPADLRLESAFPLGLLLHCRDLPAGELTALPRTREVRSASELGAGVEVLTAAVSRKARSGDLWGVREVGPDEDVRYVNWKLSAKAGRLVSVDYAEAVGSRVTVRLEGPASGEGGEARVEAAAGACRFFIDSGAEVRLVAGETEVDYGRGLLHLDRLLRALALAGDGGAARPAEHPDPAPAPGQEDARLWRRLVLAGCWLTCLSMFLVEEFRTSAALLVLPLLGAAVAAQERGWRRLPSRLWDAATLAVLLHGVLFHWRQAGVMVANTWLVAYMLVYFAFNPVDRAARARALLVFFIGFFLVSGQTISLWYFPAYLAFAAFLTAWLAAGWGAGLGPARGWPRALGAVAAALVLLSAAIFAVIPRFEPLGRRNRIVASLGLDKLTARSSAVTGFTTSVTLGYFGEIRRSGARVMRVRPHAPQPAAPPPLYVRGLAFDGFDGWRWTRQARDLRYRLAGRPFLSRDGAVPMTRLAGRLYLPGAPETSAAAAADYTVFPMNLDVLFSAWPAAAVGGAGAAGFFDYTDSYRFYAPYLAGISYTVYGRAGPQGEGALALAGDPARLLGYFLSVPAGYDPRVRELALRVTAGLSGDLQKARAVERHLRSSYRYSLFIRDTGGGVPGFLFGTREGNCEYFASAGVLLLRYAGVPARLVSGFLASEFNEYGGFYDVRQNQAHAWVEAYIRGQGWVRLDPTPAAASGPAWGRTLAGKLMRWVEAGNVRWYRHVIGYDGYAQRNTFHRLGLAVSRWNLAKSLGWLAAAAAAVWLLRAAALAWPRRRGPAAQDIFSQAQALLERSVLRREPHWTPREYAARVCAARPDLGGIARLAEEHYLERYAALPRGEADIAEARRLLAELRVRAKKKK